MDLCIVSQVVELLVLQNLVALTEFERGTSDNKPKESATCALCFMVRGLVKRLCFSVGYFSSRDFDRAQLFPTVWQGLDFTLQQ